jgi:hypothetical protein
MPNRLDPEEYRYNSPEWRLQFMTRLMLTTVITVGVMYIIVFFAVPIRGILERYQEILAAEAQGMQRLPDLQKQIATLEKQLSSLTSESIDARLKTIEQAIHAGQIKPEDVATVQDLNRDLNILKTYMFRDPTELVELKQLQKDYRDLRETQGQLIKKDDVMREINILNNLYYATTGVFGLILAVMGGFSWYTAKRPKKEDTPAQEKPVPEKPA